MGSKKANHSNKKTKKNKPSKESDLSPPAQVSNSHEDVGGDGGAKIITDSRFVSVHSDPRFQKVPKHKSKVEIDSRFDRIFTDRSFGSSSAPVDKRGRPKKKNSENFLQHYYRIEENRGEDEEEGESEEEEEERKSQELVKLGREESEPENDSSGESNASKLQDDDEESWESDSTTDEDADEDVDNEPLAPEEHIPEIEKETHRLAVVNMDWRYVKAVDLYMMLSSFLPKDGHIISVAIYPSEFGLQRMKEEELHGPIGLFDDENKKNDDSDDEEDEIDNEKLRAYERSRLRYYYAVVECDSIATADYLYKACDGVEFERSSNVLDLRFIPDSMEFKHPPRDVATEAPANYESLNFQTRALQQSKINLSWDEDEPDRVKTLKRKFNADQLADLELKEFLASDESESDENDDDEDNATEDQSDKKQKKRDMYRALLLSGDGSDGGDEENAQDMEVTFNTGLEEISKRILEKKDKKQETVWEAKLREQREKKKRRKNRSKNSSEDESSDSDQEAIEEPGDFFVEEPSDKKRKKSEGKSKKREKEQEDTNGQAEANRDELELLVADDTMENTGLKGYNLKPKKVKGKDGKKVKQPLGEDKIPPIVDDPRFSSLFTSPDFALDPTDPQFKRSATFARQVTQRKQKKTHEEFPEGEPQAQADAQPSNKDRAELSMLLKSVKMKSKQIKLPSAEKSSKKVETLHSSGKEEMKKKKGKKEKHELSTLVQSVKKKTRIIKR